MGIPRALFQAGNFGREVYPRAPPKWDPQERQRNWKLRGAAHGLNAAPVAFHKTTHGNLLWANAPLNFISLKFQFPTYDFVEQRGERRASSPRKSVTSLALEGQAALS